MREPELGILSLGLELLVAAQRDADFVEQRRAVDLLVQVGRARFLERRRDRFERGELRGERARAIATVAIIVPRHAGLRGGDRIHLPVEIEKRLLDVAETHALNNRWHSSSDNTRSVRLAASNSVRHAASSVGS